MFSKPINWWFIGFLGVLTASLWFTHLASLNHAVKLNTQVVETRMNKDYQVKLDKAVKDAIASTKAMQIKADELKAKANEELKAINATLSADIKRLQYRINRPSPEVIAKSAESGITCTAAQLYREDAEFLTREAARADGVIIERNYYYDRYVAAQRALDSLAAEKK
jgi:hypothetical protein